MHKYSLNKILQLANRAAAMADRSYLARKANGGYWEIRTNTTSKPRMRWVYTKCDTLTRATTRRER